MSQTNNSTINVPIIQKEMDISNHRKSQDNTSPSYFNVFYRMAQQREESFQRQFTELEDYLGKVLEEHNLKYSSGSSEEEKISMAKAKAKEYFKNCACEVFRTMKNKYQEQQLFHVMPEIYFKNSLDKIKENISLSLDQLTEKIVEAVSEIPSIGPKSINIKKKGKKGKTKIAKKALTVLKNWLTEHFHDPYPSHAEKVRLANEAGVTLKQVQNWFTNARGRIWKKTYNQEKFASQIEEKLLVDQVRPQNMMFQYNNPNINTNSMG